MWCEGTGRFEVSNYEEVVLRGKLRNSEPKEKNNLSDISKSETLIQYSDVNRKDFYRVLNHRGYDYNGVFKAVKLLKKTDEGM